MTAETMVLQLHQKRTFEPTQMMAAKRFYFGRSALLRLFHKADVPSVLPLFLPTRNMVGRKSFEWSEYLIEDRLSYLNTTCSLPRGDRNIRKSYDA